MLYHFVKEKLITEQEHRAWKKLRNPAAHASLPGKEDIDELVKLCHTVTGVLYKLIFRAVGYDEPYTNYHAPGWPSAKGPSHRP